MITVKVPHTVTAAEASALNCYIPVNFPVGFNDTSYAVMLTIEDLKNDSSINYFPVGFNFISGSAITVNVYLFGLNVAAGYKFILHVMAQDMPGATR